MGKIFFARVITEFEAGISTRTNAVLNNHHDQSPSVQNTKALAIAFQDAGNHFADSSDEFVIIDARDVMRDNVARIIMREHGEGQKQRADFVAHRMLSTAVAFEMIPHVIQDQMNKFHLPGNRHNKRNKSRYVNSTKKDMYLLGQLYPIVYIRQGTSYRLFEVENSDCPLSLSKHGILRNSQTSDLLPCWEVDCPSDVDEADAKLIDGANMVHC